MIKDIISFVVAGKKFAIDFQRTPIILTAKDYLTKNGNGLVLSNFRFEEEIVEIIDLAGYLQIEELSITDSSKILVGEMESNMFGLVVDKVVEIVNLNGAGISLENNFDNSELELTSNSVEISGENLALINVDNLLQHTKFKMKSG